jgi:RNA polymerase sigma-70 factor, ECF subfamily
MPPATPADDQSLVERAREGDEDAFAALVRRYTPMLMRLARMYVPTDALAEDVVQETWVAVLRGLDRFEGRSAFKTWLFRILVNRARTRAVREARSLPFSSLGPDDEDGGPAVDPDAFRDGGWVTPPAEPDAEVLAGELRGRLADIVDTLPERERTVILLRDVAGLDGPEVAEALGISEGNQRVILHRARSKVRGQLGRYLEP